MPSTPKLEIKSIVKRFGDGADAVIKGLSATVAEGQILVLLGPSGCGKTTTLQLVAGLLHPDDGSIFVDGKQVAGPGWGLPPERRNLGMVFQSYAVWPHKTVFENVAYGLELRSMSRDTIKRKVADALRLVHLDDLAARYPSEISGGQQQRVALARAIVVEPSLLLLDEPLSNLDAALREQMRIELKLLQRQLGLASIYVTHDQAEAMVLADHLVVMRDGVIAQQGPAEAVFRRPQSAFVARFFGVTNLLEGRLTELRSNGARVDVNSLGTVSAFAAEELRGELKNGGAVCISIRPLELSMSGSRPDAPNAFQGRIIERMFLGDLTEYFVQAGDIRLRVHAPSSDRFAPNDNVWIGFAAEAGTVLLNS
jgi:ABC-type Fe3+/spermidine/putrescine transport system ATPase subunit